MRERYYLLKRQNKIKTTMRLSAAMVFLSMLLCACTEASQNQEMPAATYMGGKDTIAGICEELESAGASHVDLFQEWVVDFADSAGKNAMRGQNSPQNAVNLQKKLQFFLEKGRFSIDRVVIIEV